MAIGVDYDTFWTLNPRKVKVILEGYKLKRQVKDEEMWMLGGYVFDAVTIALGNAFRKKHQKAREYFEEIKQPYSKLAEQKQQEELSEAEKKRKTELLFNNLEIMAANFRLSKGSKVS